MIRRRVAMLGWTGTTVGAAFGVVGLLLAARHAGAPLLQHDFTLAATLVVAATITALSTWRPSWALIGFAFLFPLINNASVRGAVGGGGVPASTLLGLLLLAGLSLKAATTHGGESDAPNRASAGESGDAWRSLLVVYVIFLLVQGFVAFLRTSRGWPLLGDWNGVWPPALPTHSINTIGERPFTALVGIATNTLLAITAPLVALRVSRGSAGKMGARVLLAVNAAVVLGAIVGVGHLFNVVGGLEPHFAILRQYHATFTDPNALGSFVMLLAAPTMLSLPRATIGRRLVLLAGMVAAVGLLVLSGSRTGAAGFLLACVLAWFVDRIARRRRTLAAAGDAKNQNPPTTSPAVWIAFAFVALAAIGAFLWWLTGGDTIGLLRRGTESGEIARSGGIEGILRTDRLYNWSRALDVVRSAPLAGVGPGLFTSELPNVFGWLSDNIGYRDNALNHYLQTAAELGLPGLALFAAMWLALGIALWRRIEHGAISAGTFVSWAVLSIAFMTGPHLLHPEPQFLYWLLVGLSFRATTDTATSVDEVNDQAASAPDGLSRAVLICAVVIASIGVGAAVVRATGRGSIRESLARHGLWQDGVWPSARDDDAGYADLWLAPNAELMLERGTPVRGSLMVGHPDAATIPVTVRIAVGDEPAQSFTLDAPFAELPLTITPAAASERAASGRFVIVRVTTNRPWIPAESDANSEDQRQLGVLWRMFANGTRNGEDTATIATPPDESTAVNAETPAASR